jgi:hypothetical protein
MSFAHLPASTGEHAGNEQNEADGQVAAMVLLRTKPSPGPRRLGNPRQRLLRRVRAIPTNACPTATSADGLPVRHLAPKPMPTAPNAAITPAS